MVTKLRVLTIAALVALLAASCSSSSVIGSDVDGASGLAPSAEVTATQQAGEAASVLVEPTPSPVPVATPSVEPTPIPERSPTTSPTATAAPASQEALTSWTVTDPLPLAESGWTSDAALGFEFQGQGLGFFERRYDYDVNDVDPLAPRVLYGTPADQDPFANGDLQILAQYDPHDDDYHVIDDGDGYETEMLIGGRTAIVTPWRVQYFEEPSVGFEVFWDADPDHYVAARSRSLTLPQLIEVLETVSFDGDTVAIDHDRFGIAPIPAKWNMYEGPDDFYFYEKAGYSARYILRQAIEDGEYADVDFSLVDGGASDVLMWRFLASSEEVVEVRGQTGYLLAGITEWTDYEFTALIWQETPTTIGFTSVDSLTFGPDLVTLADRTVVPPS